MKNHAKPNSGPQQTARVKKKQSHLPLYCTTDRSAMVLISLKPLKSGRSKS
jgi:hypothetical protein